MRGRERPEGEETYWVFVPGVVLPSHCWSTIDSWLPFTSDHSHDLAERPRHSESTADPCEWEDAGFHFLSEWLCHRHCTPCFWKLASRLGGGDCEQPQHPEADFPGPLLAWQCHTRSSEVAPWPNNCHALGCQRDAARAELPWPEEQGEDYREQLLSTAVKPRQSFPHLLLSFCSPLLSLLTNPWCILDDYRTVQGSVRLGFRSVFLLLIVAGDSLVPSWSNLIRLPSFGFLFHFIWLPKLLFA